MQTGLSDCNIPAKCGKKKKFTHIEIHKRNILSHNVSSWCTTKTSKVLKTLERRFAGFSLGI